MQFNFVMSQIRIAGFLLLVVFCACKTSTNPLEGQKLRIITSDPDTANIEQGPITFTLTVLAPSGYGASGAYIDFYDPIEQRARHEGPTPEDGTWQFTDTLPITTGGGAFEFAFIAEDAGAISSDSTRLWIIARDILPWMIDSIEANSWDGDEIEVQWSRPAVDTGTDTIFINPSPDNGSPSFQVEPYPSNKALIFAEVQGTTDTFTVHNAYAASRQIVWATANYNYDLRLYENGDSTDYQNSGLDLEAGEIFPTNYYGDDRSYVDLILATDPSNTASGVTIISASVASLSGFTGGRTTAFYDPVQYIDSGRGSGSNLQELLYPNDLSTYVTGVTPMYEITLPDSSQYSTAFIAVTQDGNYARVSVGPVMHDPTNDNYRFVYLAFSYQRVPGLPYAGRGRKR